MKYLGQHFLKNTRALEKIASSLELGEKDTVIEIGPGHGELTKHLKGKVIAVEKDKRFINPLREKFKNAEVVEGDALKLLPELTKSLKSYKLVGNIPYYITGRLLRIIGGLDNKPKKIILTVQKEVAERLCAEPPRMNLLAASVQFWGSPKITGSLDKSDFSPSPEVDSAIIEIVANPPQEGEKNYYKTIKKVFKQPRKTILNNLREGEEIEREKLVQKLKSLGINPEGRPQDLSIKELTTLSDVFTD